VPLRKIIAQLLRPVSDKTVLLFLLFFSFSGRAQFYNLPTEAFSNTQVERGLAAHDVTVHSGIQPYLPLLSNKYKYVPDSLQSLKKGSWLRDKLFHRDFIDLEVKGEKFKLHIDPILNLQGGKDFSDTAHLNLYTNTRGIIGAGQIGERFYFETLFAENQSIFPLYVDKQVRSAGVVPGQGRWKSFKDRGYDYAFSSGMFSYRAGEHLHIQAGHGKQKMGYGYRSLLLSDNSFNYPYLRLTTQWLKGRLQYTTIYAALMNLVSASAIINPNTERLFQKKAAAFQYLSINPAKWLNIGLFQGLVWQAGDSKNRQQLNWNYLNPLLFCNAAVYGLDNKNNLLIGADIRMKLSQTFNLYGQYMLDRLQKSSKEKSDYGFQVGFNYFSQVIQGLRLQAEYNFVSPRSYTSSASPFQHYNQALAYGPGEGQELLGTLSYQYKRFFIAGRIQTQLHESAYTSANTVNILNGRAGFVLNPAYQLQVCGGVIVRSQNFHNFRTAENSSTYFYISLRTSLYNLYYDF